MTETTPATVEPGKCCICGEESTLSGHGVTQGEIVSKEWCDKHRGEGLSGG